MNDLANMIWLIPMEEVASYAGSIIFPRPGAGTDLFLTENDVKVTDAPETKDGGELFNQSLKVVVVKMSDALRKKYSRNRQVMVLLVKTNGEILRWGDIDYPVSCSITPTVDADQISLTRKALQPLL